MTRADEFPEEGESAAANVEPDPVADEFYGGAESRMARALVVIAIVGVVGVFLFAGWKPALGFVAGCVVIAFNVRSLYRTVVGAAKSLEGKALAGEPAKASTALLAFGLVLR